MSAFSLADGDVTDIGVSPLTMSAKACSVSVPSGEVSELNVALLIGRFGELAQAFNEALGKRAHGSAPQPDDPDFSSGRWQLDRQHLQAGMVGGKTECRCGHDREKSPGRCKSG